MNSFERFKIPHLSASSLNLWRAAPGVWALRYLANIKDGGNPAMWRGTAVENGFTVILHGGQKPLTAAYQSFDLNAQNHADLEDVADERALIAPMLDQCIKWSPPSALNATQLKIEYYLDPIPVPVIGYLDFAFEGIDVDLKTTKACPSKPRSDHIRQISVYRAARNKAGGVLYVTDKRHAYFDIPDDAMNDALAELHADALSLNNYLARCETKEDAIKSLPIDYSYYQAPKTKISLADILMGG